MNSRVSTEAWRFDQTQTSEVEDANRWSYKHFGVRDDAMQECMEM